MVGSLIKNPGGGLAPIGGYIAGRKDLIEACGYRLTSPGLGKEVGASLGVMQSFYQGLFLAPTVTASALKGAIFAANIYESLGYPVVPDSAESRHDIIQAVTFGKPEGVIAFCKGIQAAAPVDSFVTPIPWAMPGYDSDVRAGIVHRAECGRTDQASLRGVLPRRAYMAPCEAWDIDVARVSGKGRRGRVMRQISSMWDFPVMDGVDFQDANRVHPLMQKRVERLIREFAKDPNIRKVILFGSSLEFRCNSASDIDLYIEKYDSDKKLIDLPEIDCEIDLISNLSPASRLYKEIEQTGLLLYER